MDISALMLEFAQALGGIHKHKGDFWIIEIPAGEAGSTVVFFRLNQFHSESGVENVLVCFTQIGTYRKGASMQSFLHLEHLLKVNAELRFSRTGLMGERIVVLAAAHELYPEEVLLEMVHEVVQAGGKLRRDLERL